MMGGSVMYGGPPDDPFGQRGGVGTWPRPERQQQQEARVAPALVPESLAQTMARMQARVAWLEKELSMHEAWKTELATLKDLIAAWSAPAAAEPNGVAPKEGE